MNQVFCGKDVELHHFDVGGELCFVTFTPFRAAKTGFAAPLLQKRNISGLFFISKWDHWYQPEEVQAAAKVAKTIARNYKRIVTYGSSMGAYGALSYSGILDADEVIAFSPQFTIDPRRPPYENRWAGPAQRISFEFDDMDINISRRASKSIIYDPLSKLDSRHVDLFTQFPNVQLIHVRHAEHYPSELLLHADLLQTLVLDLAFNRYDQTKFYTQFRQGRRKSYIYWRNLANHLIQRHRPLIALLAAEEGLHLRPDDRALLFSKYQSLAALNKWAEALEFARTLVLVAAEHPASWTYLCEAAQHFRLHEEAIAAGRKAVSMRPNHAHTLRVLFDALQGHPPTDETVEIGRQAIASAPDHLPTYLQLADVLFRAGRERESIKLLETAHSLAPGNKIIATELKKLQATLRPIMQAPRPSPTN